MTGERTVVPTDALEDIAYLTRSRHRLRLLVALADGQHTRRELDEVTDASRATLGRILTELEERGWAVHTTDGYEATTTGSLVAAELVPVVSSMRTIHRLDDAVGWLPTDELTIGLHHFEDATIRRPGPNDPLAAASRLAELTRGASRFRGLTKLAAPLTWFNAMRESLATDGLAIHVVITESLYEYFAADPDWRTRHRAYLELGGGMSSIDTPIPCDLFVIDDRILIAKTHPEEGVQCRFVESDDETVLSWAIDLYETYRAAAEPLGVDDFRADS